MHVSHLSPPFSMFLFCREDYFPYINIFSLHPLISSNNYLELNLRPLKLGKKLLLKGIEIHTGVQVIENEIIPPNILGVMIIPQKQSFCGVGGRGPKGWCSNFHKRASYTYN